MHLGKNWTVDVLTLRTPCANTGAVYMYVAVEKRAKYIIAGRMRSYTEESFISAMNEIKARVRPIHGEIHIWRGDSHSTHKSKAVRSYMADEQHRLQLSPPYVHEGVGDAESFFLWGVPSANSLLLAAPDLSTRTRYQERIVASLVTGYDLPQLHLVHRLGPTLLRCSRQGACTR